MFSDVYGGPSRSPHERLYLLQQAMPQDQISLTYRRSRLKLDRKDAAMGCPRPPCCARMPRRHASTSLDIWAPSPQTKIRASGCWMMGRRSAAAARIRSWTYCPAPSCGREKATSRRVSEPASLYACNRSKRMHGSASLKRRHWRSDYYNTVLQDDHVIHFNEHRSRMLSASNTVIAAIRAWVPWVQCLHSSLERKVLRLDSSLTGNQGEASKSQNQRM